MTVDDVIVIDGIRRDVDEDIVDTIKEQDKTVMVLQWWEMLGLEGDISVEETRRSGIVSGGQVTFKT
jgi:hypothetical protein